MFILIRAIRHPDLITWQWTPALRKGDQGKRTRSEMWGVVYRGTARSHTCDCLPYLGVLVVWVGQCIKMCPPPPQVHRLLKHISFLIKKGNMLFVIKKAIIFKDLIELLKLFTSLFSTFSNRLLNWNTFWKKHHVSEFLKNDSRSSNIFCK